MEEIVYSSLPYMGGKRAIIDRLMEKFPDGIEDFREPFFGSGSVTIAFMQSMKALKCKRIIASELSKEVYLYHMGVKNCPDEAIKAGKKFYRQFVSSKDTQEQKIRNMHNLKKWLGSLRTEEMTVAEVCAKMFILQRISFSHIVDVKGVCGVSHKSALILGEHSFDKLRDCTELMQSVELLNVSYEEILTDLDKDKSFVFFDPPYYTQENQNIYAEGNHGKFDHKLFAQRFSSLPCKSMVTYDENPYIRSLFVGYPLEFISMPVGRELTSKTCDGEIMITNYELDDALLEDDLDSLI